MELQRIIARDTRSATEQALKRYGPNVFVISNHRVAGQTELVVAVDVQAPSQDDDEDLVPSAVLAASADQPTASSSALSAAPTTPSFENSFEAKLHAVMTQKGATEKPSAPESVAETPDADKVKADSDRDWIRSRGSLP